METNLAIVFFPRKLLGGFDDVDEEGVRAIFYIYRLLCNGLLVIL